jgi:hypothetical protein
MECFYLRTDRHDYILKIEVVVLLLYYCMHHGSSEIVNENCLLNAAAAAMLSSLISVLRKLCISLEVAAGLELCYGYHC